ncbi:MAG: hypothetical protein ACRDJ9_05440 [Dehalococcoidia bacterium]
MTHLVAPVLLLAWTRGTQPSLRLGVAAQQEFSCKDPTPDEPVWWKWTWTLQPDGSSTGTTPAPPPLPSDLDLTRWAGRYTLFAVATGGAAQPDTITGGVALRVTTDTARQGVALTGFADSSIGWPGYLAFAHSPAMRGPPRHGVEVLYSRERRAGITLVFGNSGLEATDSGVLFEVFTIDDFGMMGRWVDGGLGVLVDSAGRELGHPQGYFCLRRLGP